MLSTLVEWLAPSVCAGCRRPGRRLCSDCQIRAITPHPATCWNCNRLSADWKTCVRCRRGSIITGIIVGGRYDGLLKDLILALKFDREQAVASSVAGLITPLLSSDYDAVTSVPSAPGRRRQRGFNQSGLIAKRVARELALPYRPLLGRWHQAEQIGAGRQERFVQVEAAFYALRQPPQRVLIVDDVLTTGATLNACAKALRAAGAKEVWGAAVAKH
jgi:ComF family protein